jgi:hypothetical protein
MGDYNRELLSMWLLSEAKEADILVDPFRAGRHSRDRCASFVSRLPLDTFDMS